MLFIIIFFTVVAVGIITAAILAFGGRKARPGDVPLGCTVVDGKKIQCAAYD